jgi:branched-chain amino acid transport system substrate-binding protein
MQNQGSIWLNVRRDRPDWVFLQGWGAMNPTAVKEAAKTRFPMDKFVSIWWPGEDDLRQTGADAKGFRMLNFHRVGPDFKALQDIKTHVIDKGLSKIADPADLGEHLYNRGVYNAVLIAEGIVKAQELTGKKAITGEDMRIGLENLNIDAARWAAIGLEGFAEPLQLSCADHSGHVRLYMQQWNGTAFEPASDWFESMTDVVLPMLKSAAADYVSKNQPWPARQEACATQ